MCLRSLSCALLVLATAANGWSQNQLEVLAAPQMQHSTIAMPENANYEVYNDAAEPSAMPGCIYFGGGYNFLQPAWQRNPASVRTSVNAGVVNSSPSDFTWDMKGSPSAFVGYRAPDGFGLRGRWQSFDQGVSENYAAGIDTVTTARPLNLGLTAPVGGNLLAESWLNISTYDLEFTQDMTLNNWTLTVSAGGRYAHTNQRYNAFTNAADGTLTGSLVSSHNFNGAGPTMALGARHPFGCKCLTLYSVGRGSLLWGSTERTAFQADATGTVTNFATQNATDVRPVLELEIGLEYAVTVGQSRWFVQSGFLGQVWFNAGGAAQSTGLDLLDQSDSNLGLLGISVRAGVQY